MANGVFNIAKGKVGYYTDEASGMGLSGANAALIVVILENTGLDADDTLNNFDTLAAVLAANTEATSTGYARKSVTAANVAFTVDDSGNAVQTTIADQTWTSVSQATTEAWAKLLVCWDGDTTAGTDSNIIPLTYHDFVVTPNGGDITADFNDSTGFWGSS